MASPYIAGALRLLDGILKSRRKAPAEPRPNVSEHFREEAPPREIRDQARINGQLWGMTRVVQFAAVCLVLNAGMCFTLKYVVQQRPIQEITSKGDLRQQIQAHFEGDGGKTDTLVHFLYSVFTLKYSVSPEGTPYLSLLQGLVATDIFEKIKTTSERNMATVKNQGITQSLNIQGITDLDWDDKDKKFIAVIEGVISTHIRTSKKGGPIVMPAVPYRARVIVETLPKSNINPYGYFLLSPLQEYYGEESVTTFDKEREEARARITGRK